MEEWNAGGERNGEAGREVEDGEREVQQQVEQVQVDFCHFFIVHLFFIRWWLSRSCLRRRGSPSG